MSMDGRAENCSLRFPHFHHPWWSYSAKSQEGGAVMSMDGDGLKIAPRQLLLRCPNKLHYPCNDAFSALPTSMWVVLGQHGIIVEELPFAN